MPVPLAYAPDNYTQRALLLLDKDVRYLSRQHRVRGYDPEELAQELRMHLFNKLSFYNPVAGSAAGLRAWAQTVMRRRIMDMARYKNDVLDIGYESYQDELGMDFLPEEAA